MNSWEDPAGQQGNDDSAGGDDGVVLESGGDVEEPVQGQQRGGQDGDGDDPETDRHLELTFPLDVAEISARLVPETDHHHNHHGEGEVSHGLVEDEEKDGLTAHP